MVAAVITSGPQMLLLDPKTEDVQDRGYQDAEKLLSNLPCHCTHSGTCIIPRSWVCVCVCVCVRARLTIPSTDVLGTRVN